MSKHTECKLVSDDHYREDRENGGEFVTIRSVLGDWFADVRNSKANAKRIALTWNCHDELLEALGYAWEYVSVKGDHDAAVLERIIEAVIAKAKGEG